MPAECQHWRVSERGSHTAQGTSGDAADRVIPVHTIPDDDDGGVQCMTQHWGLDNTRALCRARRDPRAPSVTLAQWSEWGFEELFFEEFAERVVKGQSVLLPVAMPWSHGSHDTGHHTNGRTRRADTKRRADGRASDIESEWAKT